MGLYWAVVGWTMLLVFADISLIVIVSTVAVRFGFKPTGANAMLFLLRQHPYLLLGINHRKLSGPGVMHWRDRAGLRVWERVVTSATVYNLDRADGVRVRGAKASALGEGFADSLDVAGF